MGDIHLSQDLHAGNAILAREGDKVILYTVRDVALRALRGNGETDLFLSEGNLLTGLDARLQSFDVLDIDEGRIVGFQPAVDTSDKVRGSFHGREAEAAAVEIVEREALTILLTVAVEDRHADAELLSARVPVKRRKRLTVLGIARDPGIVHRGAARSDRREDLRILVAETVRSPAAVRETGRVDA